MTALPPWEGRRFRASGVLPSYRGFVYSGFSLRCPGVVLTRLPFAETDPWGSFDPFLRDGFVEGDAAATA